MYMSHMYCDLALSQENVKEHFLVNYKVFQFLIIMIMILYIS